MTIELKLFTSQEQNSEGFPLAFQISHTENKKEKKRQILIGRSFSEHFLKAEKNISIHHPDYDTLQIIIKDYKAKAKKIELLKVSDVDLAKRMLLKNDNVSETFKDFGDELIKEINVIVQAFLKRGDEKSANKKLGNIEVYQNTLNQFDAVCPGITFSEINHNQIMRFRRYQEGLGNSKSTIHHYLRTLRAIYNKGILKFDIKNEKPFAGTFDGLKIKSYESKKKSISKNDIIKLESLDLSKTPAVARSRDLWLLQFYFGGADLIDIYFLEKKQFRKNRILFSRSKTNTDLPIDLAIHPKAKQIIDKYKTDEGDSIFPWRKDKKGYTTFRRNLGEDLIKIQESNNIEILPTGGNLSIKVARHSFGNLAKKYKLEEDLIRELMGHERDDVDNYYKDRFEIEIRDNGLFQVISSFEETNETFKYENILK